MENSPLNKIVSCFKNAETTEPPRDVNLLKWLQSAKHKNAVDALRREENEVSRKKMKKALPLISVAGIFTGKKTSDITQYSALLCLDIDNVKDVDAKKRELASYPFVAYCGLSCGGKGIFAIVPVSSQPNSYSLHHKALEQELEGIDISGRNINRQRFYSYDDEAYYNHQAQTYYRLFEEKQPINSTYNAPSTYDRLCVQIARAAAQNIDLTQSSYAIRLNIGFALIHEFGEAGRVLFHQICQQSPKYNYWECDKKYTDLLKSKPKIKINYLFSLLKY